MIRILKNTENGLNTLPEIGRGCWVNVVNPSPEEILHLKELDVPDDFITYPLDIDERARIEREDTGETLIIIRVPYYQGADEDVPYVTMPLGVILASQYIMTISCQENEIINAFSSGRVRNLSTGKRNRFFLRLFLRTASSYLTYLRQINTAVEVLEDKIQQSMRNKYMLELVKYQKSLVYFTTALRANQIMLSRLQRGGVFTMYPDDEDLLEDVITENQQAIEMTSISTDILTSMMDSFASIISNNLNGVMKFLASITIVLSLPTLVTSYFGMNVGLPFQQDANAYLVILGLCLALSVLVVIVFVKRDWF